MKPFTISRRRRKQNGGGAVLGLGASDHHAEVASHDRGHRQEAALTDKEALLLRIPVALGAGSSAARAGRQILREHVLPQNQNRPRIVELHNLRRLHRRRVSIDPFQEAEDLRSLLRLSREGDEARRKKRRPSLVVPNEWESCSSLQKFSVEPVWTFLPAAWHGWLGSNLIATFR